MRNPQRCFLLPLLFSQGTFCKALQGTRQLYDDSAYSSLTTQTHTHTQTLSYITAGKREELSFMQNAFIFSPHLSEKKKSMFYKRFRGYFLCLQAGLSVQLYCSSIFCLSDAILKMCLHICNLLKCRYFFFLLFYYQTISQF